MTVTPSTARANGPRASRSPISAIVIADEAEPCRADAEADQQERRDARERPAPAEVSAQERGQQEEPERERGARFDRPGFGETMEHRHRQGQGKEAREPTHGAQISAASRP